MPSPLTFFWFRRDLRLHDNTGLYHALRSGKPVQALFIFDKKILDRLEDKQDKRLVFIHRELEKLNKQLLEFGATLLVKYGRPEEVWAELCSSHNISAVYTNHDYEPYAKQRDGRVAKLLGEKGIDFHTFKDQVIFEKDEVMKDDGTPYTVFTPFMKKWRSRIVAKDLESFPVENYYGNFHKASSIPVPSLASIGFIEIDCEFPPLTLDETILHNYTEQRDLPALRGTSRLSLHLRFGTLSLRELMRFAWDLNEKWVNELIWREFYMYILWHFPHVAERSFKPKYDRLQWRTDENEFQRWCAGQTGYPIVDAGMRELNATGFMHNRVRMITAMFLTKYLLIDWRWGEAYFAQKLLDFELASNNGGWQWSAGTGVDAAPYFRIFSMDEQTKRFDPQLSYIQKWVPEFQELSYPRPMVDYAFARKRCLEFYKRAE